MRRAADESAAGGGLVRIPELRRKLAPLVPRATFDAWLLRMRDEASVHLLTHVDPPSLSPSEQVDCISEGDLLVYWVRWLSRSEES